MKTILKIFVIVLLTSCGESKFKELDYLEHNNANYWTVEIIKEASKSEILSYVTLLSDPNKTTYVFVYESYQYMNNYFDNTLGFNQLKTKLLKIEPKHSFVKLPNSEIEENALDYIKMQ